MRLQTYSNSKKLLVANADARLKYAANGSKGTKPVDWRWKSSDYLCRWVAAQHPHVLLSFSCGKDAIASYLQLRKFWKPENIHLYYYYTVPDLEFVNVSIRYYEQLWNTKILQVPSFSFMNNMKQGVFGTPATLNFWHDEQFIDGIDWNQNPVHLAAKVRDELENIAKEYFGLPTDCVTADGVTAEDSPIRRTSIITWSPWAKETRNHIRPIYDWKVADVRKAIESNNVKVPADYVIWGRSHDGIDYRFLYNIKAKFPADYEKIKHFYPLIDVELLKYNEQVALIPPKGYK